MTVSKTPLLIEDGDGFTTHWFCKAPPMGSQFVVLREHWSGTNEAPVREIHEIEVKRRPA